MATRAQALEYLRTALGQPGADFRDGQWEAIDALVNQRKRLLVVQRTGWGKSSVYFIATRFLRDSGEGLTIIISPLLALMRNQIEAAQRLGIRAETINSTNENNWTEIIAKITAGKVDAVLISPERLANEDFVSEVLEKIADRVGLMVVDEVHCISVWGHAFRPDYRRLVNVLNSMPVNMRILGTTATANDRVIEDSISQLGDLEVSRGGLMRKSLSLQTASLPSQASRLAWMVECLPSMPGTGIVYVLTKRDAEIVTAWLNKNQISALAYYSGVKADGFEDSAQYRLHLESLLLNNKIKVLVATTALGMGYDKPDLGFVVHYQAAGSVIGYYQQVGRAGRAIEQAFGILLSGKEDEDIHEYFRDSAFPSENDVNAILNILDQHENITVFEMQEHLNLRHGQIEKVLKYLSVEDPSPVIKEKGRWSKTPVLYEMSRNKIERLTNQAHQEWLELQRYISTTDCLMVFLAKSLDDPTDIQPCGKCSNCLGRPVVNVQYNQGLENEAQLFLRNSELSLECKIKIPKGAFPVYGFQGQLNKELQAEMGRVLSRWGDAGWGRMVADNKHAGKFSDDLVQAVVDMILKRWRPDPMPTWVTCVPSLKRPELVPDFSKRLAHKLGIPFVPVVVKIKNNEPQKLQQNTFHQCRNLDGVFQVAGNIDNGPVLLVDDIVDSVWTMTIIAALLKQARSGLVFPVALATTSNGD